MPSVPTVIHYGDRRVEYDPVTQLVRGLVPHPLPMTPEAFWRTAKILARRARRQGQVFTVLQEMEP